MILLQELKLYSEQHLMNKLEVGNNNFKEIKELLYKKKILKYNSEGKIQFSYVGLVIVKGKVIFVYPKYIKCESEEPETQVIKQIIKLLNAFTEREKLDKNTLDNISLEEESLEDNLISIICFLLDDYIENNIYENETDSTELNGDGEINWDETIDLIDPLIINNQWFYPNLITNKSIVDSDKYITRLHGAVINDCMKFLNDTRLNIILNYDLENIENSLEDLEDIDTIESEIEKEIFVQFNDRKKRVLEAIRAYISKKSDTSDMNLLLYGTRNFKWVWEVVNGRVFDNEFIGENKYEIFGIKSPKWIINNINKSIDSDDSNEYETKKNHLTPDILKVFEYNNEKYLLILDAKYYNLRVENEHVKGNPGIEDITKQYIYHTALGSYIKDNSISKIINAFLFPCESNTYVQGKVELDFMKDFSDYNINLIQLNVDKIIDMYCGYKKYNLENFISIIDKWNEQDDQPKEE